MQPPEGSPEWIEVKSAAEDPDLWARVNVTGLFEQVWPEYNHHGNHASKYFGALVPRFSDYQALLIDQRTGDPVVRVRSIPFSWDGTLDDLPAGIDALGLRAVAEDHPPNALSALAIEIVPAYQGLGLSALALQTMRVIARANGWPSLLGPVRPSWKVRYPREPIEEYVTRVREDGLPFDPWMRVHLRAGGVILRCEPKSMEITAPVREWERWTGRAFRNDGEHLFPGALAPLRVTGSVGEYYEPNVWILHRLACPAQFALLA